MKKKSFITVLMAFLLIFSLTFSASATSVNSTTAAKIAQLEDEIAQIKKEMDKYGPSTGIIGQIVATSPYFIVSGLTVGETSLNGVKYNIIDNPQDGSTDGLGDYAGSHKYLGSMTLKINGIVTVCNHFGSMGDKWYALADEKAAKKQQIEDLRNPKYLKESELRVYAFSGMYDIIMQIGNPYIIAYSNYIAIDDKGTTPVVVNGSTLLPIRVLIEASGGTVSWDNTTEAATIKLVNNTIKLKKDSNMAVINGTTVSMPIPAQIISSRFMVPVRFVTENLGMEVSWNGKAQVIQIKNKHYQEDLLSTRLVLENGYYIMSEPSYGCRYTYSEKWGKPTLSCTYDLGFAYYDAAFETDYADIRVLFTLQPSEYQKLLMSNPSSAYEVVNLTSANTGIAKIIKTTEEAGSDGRRGDVFILGTNGYLVHLSWIGRIEGQVSEILSDIQVVYTSISLQEAVG